MAGGSIAHRNINRGFKKLRVWNDAIDLYALAYETFSKLPFELKKVAANAIDAAHSISRNIAEGYSSQFKRIFEPSELFLRFMWRISLLL